VVEGKDLITNIINFLHEEEDWDSFEHFMIESTTVNHTYKTVKFADKLKDIICLLTGCTREELESHEFKNKRLRKEWEVTKHEIYTEENGVLAESFYLEDIEMDFNHFSEYYHAGECLINKFQINYTYRGLLQKIGTDLFRNQLHPNTWVNATFADYKPIGVLSGDPYEENGVLKVIPKKDIYPKWIISDVRFPNEVQAIKDRGGLLIKVQRHCKECNGLGYHKMDCGIGRLEHESETALDNYKDWDIVLNNTGSVEDLIEQIKEKIKI